MSTPNIYAQGNVCVFLLRAVYPSCVFHRFLSASQTSSCYRCCIYVAAMSGWCSVPVAAA